MAPFRYTVWFGNSLPTEETKSVCRILILQLHMQCLTLVIRKYQSDDSPAIIWR